MAKSKKSKILAMALCASVMTGIYASPVMAGVIEINPDNGGLAITINSDGNPPSNGIYVDRTDPDEPKIYGMFNITAGQLATALTNQNLTLNSVTMGTETINATTIAQWNAAAKASENVAGIERLQNGAGNNITEIENTLRIYDNGTISTVNGAFRVNPQGAVFAESINIGDGAFTVNNNGGVSVAQGINAAGGKFNISADGTLSMNQGEGNIFAVNDNGDITASGTFNALSGDYRVSNINGETTMQLGAANLTETQLANLNSTIREGQVVDAKELNVNGSDGGFRVKDVNDGADTMIYAVDADGNPTLMIDADTGNLATPGSISAGNGAFVANETGAEVNGTFEVNDGVLGVNADGVTIGKNFAVNAQTGAVEAVEYKVNDSNVFNASGLTASAGNVGGVEIANGKVDGVDVSVLETKFNTTNAYVAGIKRNDGDLLYGDGRTEIEGVVAVNGKDGRFYVLGEGGRTQAAVITNDGIARFGFENEKHVRLEDGALKINDADKNTVASLSDEGLTLGAENLDEAQLNNINNVIQEGGNVVANSVNVGDGAVMANSDGSFSAANRHFNVAADGTLTISGNDLMSDRTVIGAGYIDIGATHIDGFGIETDYIEAGRGNIGGVSIVNGEVDGVDISDLNTTVTSNLSGIDRIDSDNDGDLDTTIIEGALSANTSTVNMFGDTGLDFTYGQVPNGEAGVNVTGNMHFMSGADVTFNYDGTKYENKSYSLNDLVDGINDLNGRVDVLEKKTQGISYDEETGTTTVDGNLNVEGDATTGEGGNLNAGAGNFDKVSTDEITVGETYIDGDSVNSVEGNFENITADKGNIGGVGLEGGTVIADKVVTGNTTLDNEGLNVGGQTSVTADGVNVGGNGGTTVSKDGVSIADKTIISDHDVVINEGTADRVSLSETADRVSNLEQGVSELNNRVGELEDRIDKVGAMAAAIANLRTMGYDPAAPTEVAVGIGQYRDETGAALGLFHYPNRDFMLSLSVSTSGDEVMGGIGATWKFGRKSPEKVAEIKKAQAEADARRAEEAKLAKAEEMKQAAKEAKIKAQQERHAKLAAERAAQAEAAK